MYTKRIVHRYWALLLCCLACACARERGPNLLELSELGPRHWEVGDRVRLSGSGFPEGRPAQITLRGELRRAGVASRAGFTTSIDARRVAPHALEFVFTPELSNKLCGAVDAQHSTFRGDVEVLFTAQAGLGGGVTGRLDGVVIDAAPAARAEQANDARDAEGARFATFIGVELSVSEQGLIVASVAPSSRAARARLTPGDVLTELDGVVLRSVSDLIPPPNAKHSLLRLQRGPDELTLPLDSQGFRYSAPETLRWAAALAAFVFALFVLSASPLARGLTLLERRFSDRVRALSFTSLRGQKPTSLLQTVCSGLSRQLPDSFVPYSALVFVSAFLSLSAIGKSILMAEIDAVVLPAATLTAFVCTTLLVNAGARARGFSQRFARATSVLLLNLPLAALMLTIAWGAGTLRPSELIARQGVWPWQWAAATNPIVGTLSLLCLFALVPLPRAIAELEPLAQPLARSRGERALELVFWVHALSASGFVALVALGGPSLPWPEKSLPSQCLGAFVLLLKAWSLLGAAALVRFSFGAVDVLTVRRAAWWWLGAPSLAGLAVSIGAARLANGPTLGPIAATLAPAVCAATLVTLGVMVQRVLRALRKPAADGGVQPWL